VTTHRLSAIILADQHLAMLQRLGVPQKKFAESKSAIELS